VKGLLLAGGNGTRLRPLTSTDNKHMIPIANKPMIFYGLNQLIKAGIDDIAIVVGPHPKGIRESVGNGSKFNIKIKYINQPDPKGLADAVKLAEEFIGSDPFIMYLGDILMKEGLTPLISRYHNDSSDCVICVSNVSDPSNYGVVELNSSGEIIKLIEKPTKPKSNWALAGIYLFTSSIFKAVKSIQPSWRNEFEITDAIQYLVENNKKISIHKTNGWWKDTGKPKDLLEANQLILESIESKIEIETDPTCDLIGNIIINENTTIYPNSKLRGPIIIGKNCKIGPNVYIGPYTSIGDNTIIESGEIESSIVMDNVYLNSKKRIVESLISRNSKIESSLDNLPTGLKLIVGENSYCRI
jgi:glucose-1-phosphate thymidylyltransferase